MKIDRRGLRLAIAVASLVLLALSGCSDSATPTIDPPDAAAGADEACDAAPYPSAAWSRCEARNFRRILEAPAEQASPVFQARLLAQSATNAGTWTARLLNDPSWLDPRSGNSPILPVCAAGGLGCSGDPFRHPEAAGADGRGFYQQEAVVTPVLFYDRRCARISGHIWRPRQLPPGARLPAVVIENGSVQAPEALYWWAAQALVRGGYMVLTHDARGQGRSDFLAPGAVLGSNLEPDTFWLGLVDAIDFLRSTPERPHPRNAECARHYPTPMTAFNPEHGWLDRDRLGLAGHSFGAAGVGFVQSYGAEGAEPWPGLLDSDNPVDVIVAWDALGTPESPISANAGAYIPAAGNYAGPLYTLTGTAYPAIVPRVPALDLPSEYGVIAAPFLAPPSPERHLAAFRLWQSAGVPVTSLVIRGGTHLETSPLPPAHATSWCREVVGDRCVGSWGLGLAEHYTLAWFDRWLKRPGEPGHADADARLLDDAGEHGRRKLSFHFLSARDFPDRLGRRQHCENLRGECGQR